MSTIYIIEPGATGGVGAMGAEIVASVLQRAGHDARRIHVNEQRGQLDMFTQPLRRPDAFFVSLLYPRQFVELRAMFERIGLDPYRDRRGPEDPLVAFGGQFAIAPEPVAEFADVIALGDGEVTAVQIAECLDDGMRRLDVERWAVEQPWLYAPRYQQPPDRLVRAETDFRPIAVVPGGDRAIPTIEAARGCASKCAFCTIGWAGGTYREARRDDLASEIERHAGGRINVFAPDLSSVSYADDIEHMVEQNGCRNLGRDARMDRTLKLIERGAAIKSYSFGIEGISERLRALIGKPLSRDTILSTMERLGRGGVTSVRWYLILGIPGENDDDLGELLQLIEAVTQVYSGKLDVTQTVLQPAPHTPLQWMDGHAQPAALARGMRLRDEMRGLWQRTGAMVTASMPKGIHLHEHDTALQRATRDWHRYLMRSGVSAMRTERWREIAASVSLDAENLLGPLDPDAITPWSHVDVGARSSKARAMWDRIQRTVQSWQGNKDAA